MKKSVLSILACAAIALTGCYDDADLQNRIGELEEDVTDIQGDIESIKQELATINSNVSALQTIVNALQENVYVSDVYEVKDQSTQEVIGFTIVFTNNEIVTVYNGKDGAKGDNGQDGAQGAAGKDGATPVIGLQLVNGVYCWTVNGELLKDADGNAVPATGAAGKDGQDGATPQFRINEGFWEVSFNGSDWEQLGSATGTITAADAVFSDVKETSEGVVFVLADGSKIVIPREQPFGLVFEKTSGFEVAAGSTASIPYTVRNSNGTTEVDAIASGYWEAEVVASDYSSGTVNVTAPEDGKDGKVLVYATDGYGNSDLKTLCFFNGVLEIVAPSEEVPVEGGTVDVQISSNITYSIDIPSDAYWVNIVETKAAEVVTETVTFAVDPNDTPERRTASIAVLDAQGCTVQTIVVTQASNEYSAPAFECDVFKAYVLANFDLDGDGEISSEEAGKVEEISYDYNSGDGISSFAGVEAFYNLRKFTFNGSYLYDVTVGSIDLTRNGKLETIEVKNASSVKELNVKGLKNVTEISIATSGIGYIDLSSMSALRYLYAQNSGLTSIDLATNGELLELSVYGTGITELDVTPCPKLKELNAGTETLTELDLSGSRALERLTLDNVGASAIDFSALESLTYFQLYTAKNLETIDLSGSPLLEVFYGGSFSKVKLIDVSAAANLGTFNIYSYYSLEKVRFSKAVEGRFSVSGYWGSDGETYVYVTIEYVEGETVVIDDYTCGITDEYARKHILKQFDADNDGKIDADEAAAVKELDLSDFALESAEGLDMFPLESLDLSGNRLTEFDATGLSSLKRLDLSDNRLEAVNALDDAEDMEYLDLSGNNLSGSFSDRNLPSYCLTYLDLSDNAGITSIDPYYMYSLVEFRAANTSVSAFYATDIPATVEILDLSGTKLNGQVKFSRASGLQVLDISNTAITSIDITKAATNGSIRQIIAENAPLALIIVGTGNSLPEGAVTGVNDYVVLNVADPTKTVTTNEWSYIKTFTPGTGAVEQDFNINWSKSSKGFVIEAGGEASISVKAGCKVLKFFAIGVNGTPSVEISRSSGKAILTKDTDTSSWGESYRSTGENPLTTTQNDAASDDDVNLLIDGDKDYRFYNLGAAYDSSTKTDEDETFTFKVTGNSGEKVIIFGINMSSSRDDEE